MSRLVDVCSLCGAEVEPDADGPCCDGAEVVQVELLSALEATGRDLAAETLRIQAEQVRSCRRARIEDQAAANRLLVGADCGPYLNWTPKIEARVSAQVARSWEDLRRRGEL